MKINRHHHQRCFTIVKPGFVVVFVLALVASIGMAMMPGVSSQTVAAADPEPVSRPPELTRSTETQPNAPEQSQAEATRLLGQVLEFIVAGPAFDARVRETVWTAGREVLGHGTYQQAGGGTGRYHLQVTMHDGHGKHHFQQISDGRLAWTRTEIAGNVNLRRVDVGRLDEWVRVADRPLPFPPRLLVGAWAEMLSTVHRDYVLRVDTCTLRGEPMWVITGDLRQSRRREIQETVAGDQWPELHPTKVRIAIRRSPETETGFGQWLPARIEYWSDPAGDPKASKETDSLPPTGNATANRSPSGRLITLIELYSMRPIDPPSAEQFRFDNKNAEVDIVNETDRYIQQYGIQLTQRDRLQLRR